MRFLVADCGQQLPVDAVVLGGLFKELAVARQPRAVVADEAARADVIEIVVVPVIAIENACQFAVAANLLQILVGALQQRVVAAGWERPCDRVCHLEIQCDP